MDPNGRIVGRYDKRHLVPFGEYVPLGRLLFFANVIAGGTIGAFAPGEEATLLSVASARVGVAICYEAIFPAEVRAQFRAAASFWSTSRTTRGSGAPRPPVSIWR